MKLTIRSTMHALSVCAAALALGVGARASAQEALPSKAAGVIRIGIAQPRVQMAGADPAQAAHTVRNVLAGYLQGPTIEVALLGARLPAQYAIEARQADCDFVLATTLIHKPGKKSGGASALGGLTNYIPYGGSVDYAKTAIASAVLQSAQDFASAIRARDDMQIDVRLEALDGGKPFEKTHKRRANADGEDLLTPLAESAADSVGAALPQR